MESTAPQDPMGESESAVQTAAPVLERPCPLIATSARGGRVPVCRPSREHCFRTAMTVSIAARRKQPTAAAAAAAADRCPRECKHKHLRLKMPIRTGPISHVGRPFTSLAQCRYSLLSTVKAGLAVFMLFAERFRNAFTVSGVQ